MKISQITFTRFLAAIAIVISHFNKDMFVYKTDYIADIFLKANVGVSYFFILSGFIMIVAYHKKEKIGYFEYYKNRFARIYALYVLGLLLYLVTRYSNFSVGKGFLYLFGLQSWIPGKAMILNFPGWSISVEFLFYLIFPLLYNYYYSKKNKSIWVIGIVLWIVTQVFSHLYAASPSYKGPHTESHEFLYYFPVMHISEFLVGNLAGLFFVNHFKQKNYDVPVILIFAAIMLALIFVPLFYHNGLMAVLFIPLIILLSWNNGLVSRLFSLKPLEYLGEASYAVYITHIPVLYILREVLKWQDYQLNINSVFWIYLVALIITSMLFYQFIEKPLRDLLKKVNIR
ncbi:Peptidoglycan/LPS O-acetylase OafA/YrhL, contains acyltransferase and SGNH-hydrolase domains [Chryseobacterium oleae]|uniref:Peptidoglycan/LPS O-acetylase OafA/YrhL, contains acyltransferase and SGNH-hydrolase domains n=1 Tax=Chryseobacterium oleae TaxID=491207 RepID=A0A1I4ZBU7_CHROL|nr:acyltransferase [Chryseobacterium oleae]SFN47667.1 Peptidoglycan/LPS O-acetylase OafA/YrhL, contains acyltransferase and SGNH-hydrolase domains [Chryseobacterium oleae]